jgi:hypothetical protein
MLGLVSSWFRAPIETVWLTYEEYDLAARRSVRYHFS